MIDVMTRTATQEETRRRQGRLLALFATLLALAVIIFTLVLTA
jgi:hypothetical protein